MASPHPMDRGTLSSHPKFRRVMREFGRGQLHHGGSGDVVERQKVALAIAFDEAREAVGKKRKKGRSS